MCVLVCLFSVRVCVCICVYVCVFVCVCVHAQTRTGVSMQIIFVTECWGLAGAVCHCSLTLMPFFFCVLFLLNLQRANVTKHQGTPISIERKFNTISYIIDH